MKKLYIIILAVLFSATVMAQTKKADRLFDQWEYFRAAKLYEKAAAKNPSADTYFKLGECYRLMKLYKQEQLAYDKVNALGTYSNPEFYLNYGQVLKTNGQYEQAKKSFDKFNMLMPNDPRGNFYSESIGVIATDKKYDEPITISNVTALNTNNADFCPVFYKDGLVFASSRKTAGHGKIYGWTGTPYVDLYFGKKGITIAAFTDVEPFGGKKINKKYHDGPASFSKDFNTIYFSRVSKDLKGKEKKTLKIERVKIYSSTLVDNKWTEAVPFTLNSDTYSMANPYLTADGTKLYFVSDMPGGYGETDIYYCNREGDGWSKPINMGPNVNTFNREKYPNMDSKGNFYFSSDGYQGFGGMDICVALNNGGTLEKAIPMKYPFNSSADDYGIIFTKEGKAGYFSSNRPEGGQGDDDIVCFDLLRDNVDTSLVTSIYTIGYQPKPKIVLEAIVPIPETPVILQPTLPVEMKIYFDYDKSAIRTDAVPFLDSVAKYMKEYPNLTLIMGGHCDDRGTVDYNLNLSNKRNNSAISYLNKKGIKSNRIKATGYGISKLIINCGTNCTEAEHQLNRRVELSFENQIIGELK